MNLSIPNTWQTTKLSELAIFVLGGDWGKDADFESPDYATALCIRGAEFRNWNEDKGSTASLRKIKKSSLANRVLKDSDILVEISGGGPDQPVGRTVLIDKVALSHAPSLPKICTNFVRLLRTSDEIDSRFLNSYLTFFYASGEILDYQAGSNNLRNLKFNDYLGIDIPVPPLNEQHRIVARIEELFSELDKGIENLKTAQAQLKVYRQALLKHAFEGKLTAQWREQHRDELETAAALQQRIQQERAQRYQLQLADWQANGGSKPKAPKPLPPLTAKEVAELPELPEGWGWVTLAHIQSHEKYAVKAGPFGSALKKEFYVQDGYKIYGQEQVIRGDSEYGDYFIDECKYKELASCAIWPFDVLISLVGTIGKVLVLPDSAKPGIINPRLVKISLNLALYRPNFFKAYFESGFLRSLYANESQGTTMDILNLGMIQRLPYPLCSVTEQEKMLEILDERFSEVDQLDQTLTTSLQQAEALRQSILKRAFSGQLVAQDASDEPASVLLERIKAERATQATMAKPRKPKQAAADPAPEKSNVIPFPVRLPDISATDLHAGILARAYQHHEHAPKYLPYFGHVKAEKIAHLVEAHLGIDLEREPIKDAAGPNDYPHLKKVESRASKANWFDMRKKKDADAYELSKKHGFDALLLKTMKALGGRTEEVDALINLLLPLNSRQAEIVATLYAAWNNLLLQGQAPDDEAIVHEARENWHASKLNIERDKFFRGLQWMREKGLVPSGRGRYVGSKRQRD
jgi:type I restriction enzyme S subunit